MYTCTWWFFFFNKNWITLCIFFSNLLFKMCIYILEYVILIQIQNSKRTQSSIVRSKSPSHPICQHLVSLWLLVLYILPETFMHFSNICVYILLSQMEAYQTLFLHLMLLPLLYYEWNIFRVSLKLFQQHPHYADGLSLGSLSPYSDYFICSHSLL